MEDLDPELRARCRTGTWWHLGSSWNHESVRMPGKEELEKAGNGIFGNVSIDELGKSREAIYQEKKGRGKESRKEMFNWSQE